jgi:2-dehydro-3-deoxy-D-arabinonate dehydratase
LPRSTAIEMEVRRGGVSIFAGETSLESMKREFTELAAFLFRDNDFPAGCFLLTGTGIVPPNEFTLAHGDEIRIRVTGLGMLINSVA